MGNHCIYCPYCGECSRCKGCEPGCPGKAYETAMDDYRHRQAAYVDEALKPLRDALKVTGMELAQRWAQDNPPPLEPKRVT